MGKTVCICGGQITDDKCIRCKTPIRASNPRTERAMVKQRAYRSKRWVAYSVDFRKKFPLCAHCLRLNYVTAISKGDGIGQVDHIETFKDMNDPKFWEPENHQGLCLPCHGRKTALENAKRYTKAMIRRDKEQRQAQIDKYDEEYG